MRKLKTSYRTFAGFLAVWIFLSSFSFSLDLHYCNGKIISYSLIGKAESCEELSGESKTLEEASEQTSKTTYKKIKSCCQDEQIVLDNQFEITKSELVNDTSQEFIAVCNIDKGEKFINFITRSGTNNYVAPPLTPNLTVLNSVFII